MTKDITSANTSWAQGGIAAVMSGDRGLYSRHTVRARVCAETLRDYGEALIN